MRVGEVTELVLLVGAANRVVAAMYAAGLEPWDVHVRDLLSGRITVEGFRCTVLVGGFSYADVLESARVWCMARTAASR
ncbi:hypothetical protein BLSTO_06588 [Blastocystis sp. subtype 1]